MTRRHHTTDSRRALRGASRGGLVPRIGTAPLAGGED